MTTLIVRVFDPLDPAADPVLRGVVERVGEGGERRNFEGETALLDCLRALARRSPQHGPRMRP